MSQLNNDEFNQLLSQGKIDEAKQLIKDFINSEWTEADQGEHYVDLITSYIKMSNTVNEAYIAELLEIKEALEKIDQIKDEAEKDRELGKIRDQINKL